MSEPRSTNVFHPSVGVVGGGRWARELIKTLAGVVAPSTTIDVYSAHNAKGMSAWATDVGLAGRLKISSDLPADDRLPGALIVANAARDHLAAAEWAIGRGVPVLVEKPVALTRAEVARMVRSAEEKNVPFAPALVFFYVEYLRRFADRVNAAGRITRLNIRWTDLLAEVRYGQEKRHDPSVSMSSDLLPHIVAILSVLGLDKDSRVEAAVVHAEGAHAILDLNVSGVPCSVELARGSDSRRRFIDVETGNGKLLLDFSVEPGTITSSAGAVSGDEQWETRARPLTRLLSAFLRWAGGGEKDPGLDSRAAVTAAHLTDEVQARLVRQDRTQTNIQTRDE